jgi:DNA-binding FadR family transcriptional regulator
MDRSDQALSKVREFIEKRDFAADGRIPPERTLATELRVGRRSLRRALEVLEQEGRIHRHQGRGTFVHAPPAYGAVVSSGRGARIRAGTATQSANAALDNILDYTNPLEVIEVRLSTEPAMARLAALRASTSEIMRLQTLASKTRDASDPETYERADALFHRTIAQAARNTLFLAFFDTMCAQQRDAGWRRLGEHAHCYKRQAVYAGFHESIAAAIAARNGQEAHAQMLRHLGDVQQYLYEQAFPRSETAQ